MENAHIPVLLHEVVDLLQVEPGTWFIDATFGRGGHTREIIARGGQVIALDCDQDAIAYGRTKFVREIEQKKLVLIRENFDHIDEALKGRTEKISGILADFGVSSPQLDDGKRGFSFQTDNELDMRMDDRLGVKAKDLVNALGKKELYEIITTYGGEQHARVIVDAILSARSRSPIQSTRELADIIERKVRRQGKLHPATKTFMALRMVVNDELGSIKSFLPKAFELLASGGRLVTISFHEGEDRLVKHFMKDQEAQGKAEELTKRPIEPSMEEVQVNGRSRSAKLRGIQKK